MKFTQNLARAAMLLLLAVLTSTGAWANEADDLSTPLTLEAKTAGATVKFTLTSTPANGVEFSTDGINWSEYESDTDITLTNAGDKVQFRGNNASYNKSRIQCSADCYVYGNIMSLITPTNFATAKTLTGDYTFYNLFYENSHIVNHESKKLMLPATTLAYGCYEYMFYKCENLKNVPALPATTLANYCYYDMFGYCTSLENVPTDLLPATTLADGCYEYMFYKCENLEDAPALPATTLADYCYCDMFAFCTSLTEAPALPATTLANYCYEYMFYGCTSLTEAPALPATTLADYCYYYMFYGCTSLTEAPALPATTLAVYCYYDMFYNCTSLTEAPALPATKLADGCYEYMFYGCTSLTEAPDLPATKLADACYEYMFYGCTSLTEAPALPATKLADYCYYGMFYDCTSLTEAPALPATTLANYCYEYMFYGCTSLTEAPALPATKLADGCYYDMFAGCSSLTEAPDLPATKLAEYCYYGMFYNCSSLTEAPDLPATELADYCYYAMFEYCTSLTEAPALPATKLAEDCYYCMFYGCTSLAEAPDLLPATELADYCYCGMFYGCSSLTKAPDLPATKLADYCYYYMFYNCNSLTEAPALPATKLADGCYYYMFCYCPLNSITCYATDLSAYNCTYYWVYEEANLGTIYIAKGTRGTWATDSDSGIPSGWTVVEVDVTSVAAGSFSTQYYGEAVSLTGLDEDMKFYTVGSVGADKVVLQKITQPVIPANTPFLVYNANESVPKTYVAQTVEPEQEPQPLQVARAFKGTATDKAFSDAEMSTTDHYLLFNNAFLSVKGAGSVAAHRCWLELPVGSAARELSIVFDDATGINEANRAYKANRADETYYDLQGRKIVHSTLSNGTLRKGLYIMNGKKIVK